jgi:hypothetical protein
MDIENENRVCNQKDGIVISGSPSADPVDVQKTAPCHIQENRRLPRKNEEALR